MYVGERRHATARVTSQGRKNGVQLLSLDEPWGHHLDVKVGGQQGHILVKGPAVARSPSFHRHTR